MDVTFKMYSINEVAFIMKAGKLLNVRYLPREIIEEKYIVEFDPMVDDFDMFIEEMMEMEAPSFSETTSIFRRAQRAGYLTILPVSIPAEMGIGMPNGAKFCCLLTQTRDQLKKLRRDYPDRSLREFITFPNCEPVWVMQDGNVVLD